MRLSLARRCRTSLTLGLCLIVLHLSWQGAADAAAGAGAPSAGAAGAGRAGAAGARYEVKHLQLTEGEDLRLVCPALQERLDSYRWAFVRQGSQRPQVVTAGRRVVVGEPRLQLEVQSGADEGVPYGRPAEVLLVLTLSALKRQDGGLYMCWRHGQRPHPQIAVTVLAANGGVAPQRVTALRGPIAVHYGEPATLECEISPPHSAQVTWLRDGVRVPSSPSYRHGQTESPAGVTTFTLTVTALRRTAVFSCLVASEPGTRRDHTVAVPVDRIASLSASPPASEVQYGQSLRLTCTASGNPGQIVWLKDGAPLPPTPGRRVGTREGPVEGGYESWLVMESFAPEDNGQYACYFGGTSRELLINIESRLGQFLGLESSHATLEQPLTLTCRTQYSRDDQQWVQWTVDGSPIPPSLAPHTATHHDPHNVTRHVLTYPRAGLEHEGRYTCVTAHGHADLQVTVMDPPSVYLSQSGSLRVEVGDDLTISCEGRGRPLPAVTWYRKDDYGAWVAASQSYVLHDGPAVKASAGEFQCIAVSAAGNASDIVTVTVIEPPPRVVSLVASEAMVGTDLMVTCVVENWSGVVDFVFGKRSLRPTLNDRSRYGIESVVVTTSETTTVVPSGTHLMATTLTTLRSTTPRDSTLKGINNLAGYSDDQNDADVRKKRKSRIKRSRSYVASLINEEEFNDKEVVQRESVNIFDEARPLYGQQYTNEKQHEVSSIQSIAAKLINDEDDVYSYETQLNKPQLDEYQGSGIGGRFGRLVAHTLRVSEVTFEDQGVYACHAGPNGAVGAVPVIVKARPAYVASLSTGATADDAALVRGGTPRQGGTLVLLCTLANEKQVMFLHNGTRLHPDGDDNRTKILLRKQQSQLESDSLLTQLWVDDFAAATEKSTLDLSDESYEESAMDLNYSKRLTLDQAEDSLEKLSTDVISEVKKSERNIPRAVIRNKHDSLKQFVLVREKVVAADAGSYSCAAAGNKHELLSVVVQVAAPASVESLAASPLPLIGGELLLSCNVIGWLGQVTFIHNDTVMDDSSQSAEGVQSHVTSSSPDLPVTTAGTFHQHSTLLQSPHTSHSTHQLLLSNLTLESSGTYGCRAGASGLKTVNVTVYDVHVNFDIVVDNNTEENYSGGPSDGNMEQVGRSSNQRTVIWFNSTAVLRCSVDAPVMPGLEIAFVHNTSTSSVISDDAIVPCHDSENNKKYNPRYELETPPPFSFLNSQDTQPLPCSPENKRWMDFGAEVMQKRKYDITLPTLDMDMAGTWRCSVRWRNREWSSLSRDILLYDPPRIISAPAPFLTAPANEGVVLTCVAEGAPAPQVTWSTATGSALQKGTYSATLALEPPLEGGVFTCRASVGGRVVYSTTTLEVIADTTQLKKYDVNEESEEANVVSTTADTFVTDIADVNVNSLSTNTGLDQAVTDTPVNFYTGPDQAVTDALVNFYTGPGQAVTDTPVNFYTGPGQAVTDTPVNFYSTVDTDDRLIVTQTASAYDDYVSGTLDTTTDVHTFSVIDAQDYEETNEVSDELRRTTEIVSSSAGVTPVATILTATDDDATTVSTTTSKTLSTSLSTIASSVNTAEMPQDKLEDELEEHTVFSGFEFEFPEYEDIGADVNATDVNEADVAEHLLEAEPGAPVELSCSPYSTGSQISWTRKRQGTSQVADDADAAALLFIGSLDLAGVPGTSVTEEGHLLLQPQHFRHLLPDTFTCLVLNQDTWKDVPVHAYTVTITSDTGHTPITDHGTTVTAGATVTRTATSSSYDTSPSLSSTSDLPSHITIAGNTARGRAGCAHLMTERGVSVSMASPSECSGYPTQSKVGAEKVILNPCGLGWQLLLHTLRRGPLLLCIEYVSVQRTAAGTVYSPATLLYLYLGGRRAVETVTAQGKQELLLSVPDGELDSTPAFLAELADGVQCLLSPACVVKENGAKNVLGEVWSLGGSKTEESWAAGGAVDEGKGSELNEGKQDNTDDVSTGGTMAVVDIEGGNALRTDNYVSNDALTTEGNFISDALPTEGSVISDALITESVADSSDILNNFGYFDLSSDDNGISSAGNGISSAGEGIRSTNVSGLLFDYGNAYNIVDDDRQR